MSIISKFLFSKQIFKGIGVFVALCCFGYYWYTTQLPNRKPNLDSIEQKVIKKDIESKITQDTVIVQKMVYIQCNDVETYKTKPAINLIGLTRGQLQNVYPDWIIDSFNAREVVMHHNVNGLCREHANSTFIGLKDGYVTIFYGKPGKNAIVKEITNITADRLMPQDIKELRKGIVVENREKLLRTLEGLQSR